MDNELAYITIAYRGLWVLLAQLVGIVVIGYGWFHVDKYSGNSNKTTRRILSYLILLTFLLTCWIGVGSIGKCLQTMPEVFKGNTIPSSFHVTRDMINNDVLDIGLLDVSLLFFFVLLTGGLKSSLYISLFPTIPAAVSIFLFSPVQCRSKYWWMIGIIVFSLIVLYVIECFKNNPKWREQILKLLPINASELGNSHNYRIGIELFSIAVVAFSYWISR